MNVIAETISRRRKELGLTQKELSEKLNVSDKTLSRWETGKQIPDALTLLNIAQALNLSVSEMYGRKEAEVPRPPVFTEKKQIPFKEILICIGAAAAVIAAIAMLILCIGNHRLKSKVSYEAREVPVYALTAYDYSVLDWIKECNKAAEEIGCLSSFERDPETGEAVAHYLFYLPHGYKDTKVKVRCQLGRNTNVLKVDFKNTTQTMDDNYYLCYMRVKWEEDIFGLETSLDGKPVSLHGSGFAKHVAELCKDIFAVE